MSFPKYVYVKEELDGDDLLLFVDPDPKTFAEVNDTIRVGKYKLVDEGNVTAPAEFTGDDE